MRSISVTVLVLISGCSHLGRPPAEARLAKSQHSVAEAAEAEQAVEGGRSSAGKLDAPTSQDAAAKAVPGGSATAGWTVPPEPVSEPTPTPSPEEIDHARDLVKRGELLYRNGQYDEAELALKEAITIYPFLAQANLLLGKVFLIRGAAKRDLSLIRSARLMFEMARALDASLAEADVLLNLFANAPPE